MKRMNIITALMITATLTSCGKSNDGPAPNSKPTVTTTVAEAVTTTAESKTTTEATTKTTEEASKKVMDVRSKFANQTYDMCVVMNDAILVCCNVYLEAQKEFYKQTKAVFMKAVTVSDKKLEESSIYAQAVAEAALVEIDTIF